MIKSNTTPVSSHISKAIPGPGGYPLLTVWPKVWWNPLGFFMEMARRYGDVVCLESGAQPTYLLSHPAHVQYILQDNYRNYRKYIDMFKPLLGEGLATSEGDFWLRQRRLMQPAFHRHRIAALVPAMTETTAAMLERWQSVARRGEPLDIGAEMMRLTLSIIVKTMLGAEASDEAEARVVARALNITLEHLHRRAWALIKLPEHWPTLGNRRFRRSVDTLDKIVYRIIDEHRRQEDTSDLLSMLLLARDEETGEGMSDQQLRDEVMTAFTAGHETTANALAWTWYLLAHHPHVAARLQAELTTVLGGRPPTFRDLSNLNYTRQVIEEAMRLYPPLWITGRLSLAEDEIDGYSIPAEADILLCPYVTHRHPAFWEQPEVFDPDRFRPERSAGRPRYAYFPFGGGPHQCIGNHFALIEAQVILAMVAQTYRLDLVPGQSIKPRPMIALKPHPRILMTLHSQPVTQSS